VRSGLPVRDRCRSQLPSLSRDSNSPDNVGRSGERAAAPDRRRAPGGRPDLSGCGAPLTGNVLTQSRDLGADRAASGSQE